MKKLRIGISIGDLNGISLEVIMKALDDKRICNMCTPVIYGSTKVVSYHKNTTTLQEFSFQSVRSADQLKEGAINVVNCWQESVEIALGQLNENGGKYALVSLDKACNDLKYGLIDALVTAPINKKAMELAGFEHPGHTEFLTETFEAESSLMLMMSDDIKIGVVTNHVPLKKVAKSINKELILKKIAILERTLRMDFGIDKPKIAVLGLNPHAGDEGLLGEEEIKHILPAVEECKKKGLFVFGPYPADGFFGANQHKQFDAVLAMYHDQGLIPFKLLSFGAGVNFTAGLSIVRTSPDHGTAFDIAGKDQANPASFRKALYAAIDICRDRNNHEEMNANPLKRSKGRQLENIENEKAFEVKKDEPPKA